MKKKVIKNAYNTRIPCICQIRTASMMYKGLEIGTISEESNDAGETDWVIRVDWENWERTGKIQIAGIDMDLRLDEYIRTFIPAFVEERTLPDTRDGLWDELDALGMDHNDRFEFMCRTHGLCGCNDITVEFKSVTDGQGNPSVAVYNPQVTGWYGNSDQGEKK